MIQNRLDDHDHDDAPAGANEPYGPPPTILPGRAKLAALAGAAIVATALLRSFFFVDMTEYAYVTQFGEPLRLVTEPGLGFKWPYQSLWRFDRRLRVFSPPAREMLTKDKENLNIQWYAAWRLPERSQADIEPTVKHFLQAVGNSATAELRLEERIQSALAAEVGRTELRQFVSLRADEVRLNDLAEQVLASVRQVAREQFGLDVVDVRIKRFTYPESVKPAVFAEIRSERERVAVQYRAEGASQKAKIESLATLQRDQLLAHAQREATRIRGEGEAQAIETLNAAHSRNPRFYELLKTLETYRAMLDDQTTVVLSKDSPLLKLLTDGLPKLESTGNPSPKTPAPQPANATTETGR